MEPELRDELKAIQRAQADLRASFVAHERVTNERFERMHSDIRGLRASEDTGRFRALDAKDFKLAEMRKRLLELEAERRKNQHQWVRAVVLVLVSAVVGALATWVGVR